MKRIASLICLILLCVGVATAAAPQPAGDLASRYNKVRFSWGADMGGSVDLSGNDMSSVDFSLSFGMKYRWIKLLGVGAGANIMVSNSCRTFPVYATFHTDFSSKPQLLFMDLKGGVGFNYLEDNRHSTGAYVYAGMGINFARTAKFASFMSIGYTFLERNYDPNTIVRHPDLHMATIKIGINF